jgi:hypothetical protein
VYRLRRRTGIKKRAAALVEAARAQTENRS